MKKNKLKDWKHPELEEGEIFLGNIVNKEELASTILLNRNGNVRIGKTAYTPNGEVVHSLFPVFGKKIIRVK